MSEWRHTTDLTDDFFPKLKEVAKALSTSASVCTIENMLGVMMSESNVRANAWNRNGNASGLIQFMPKTLELLGWRRTHGEFRQLTPVQQLPFVYQYYSSYVGHLHTATALYVATFLPAFTRRASDPAFVLTAKNGPLGWAYAPNAVFDINNDYAITVAELHAAIVRNCRGARWEEIKRRIDNLAPNRYPDDEPTQPERPDLRTVQGIQDALIRIGLSSFVGNIDGLMGPRTHAAIIEFQKRSNLKVDGIVGPLTRKALSDALK